MAVISLIDYWLAGCLAKAAPAVSKLVILGHNIILAFIDLLVFCLSPNQFDREQTAADDVPDF